MPSSFSRCAKDLACGHSALSREAPTRLSRSPLSRPLPQDTNMAVERRYGIRSYGLSEFHRPAFVVGSPQSALGSTFSLATIASMTAGTPMAVVSSTPLYDAAAVNAPGWCAASANAPYPPVDTPATDRVSPA